jgi:hypothetical protein
MDKNNNEKVPNVHGQKYKVKEWFIDSGIHTIDSPEYKTYNVRFKQKGRFVSTVDGNNNECLGVWHNTLSGGWQLYLSIAKDDNDTFILTPKKTTSKNRVKELEGVNIESGSSKTNPSQNLGVGYIKYKRID